MNKARIKVNLGDRFGMLVVLGEDSQNKTTQKKIICRCDCGNIKSFRIYRLVNGEITSCGCETRKRRTMYKMNKTRIYNIWNKIKERCNNKKNKSYKYYGGRGITYDAKREKFEGFYEDMKEGYDDKLTIDRIDNNGNYCKENCRRATQKQQANNKRDNHYIKYNGEKKTITQWSELLSIKKSTIDMRLNYGFPPGLVLYQGKITKEIKSKFI